jgi:hypothetical protein
MLDNGESQEEVIGPYFNRDIMIDFRDATITHDVGFSMLPGFLIDKFIEIFAIMPLTRQFGDKKRNRLSGKLWERSCGTIFYRGGHGCRIISVEGSSQN